MAIQQDKAVQIVSIGTVNDRSAFIFHKEKFHSILNKIDQNTKVSVISVVGAFRTGKSFLLSWFLRYLTHRESSSSNDTVWHGQKTSLDQDGGFHWRGGSERDTTGIWMWNKPFYLPHSSGRIAVLLVDTQGMFDNVTTMNLTSSIFCLSTLISSHQIYNVDKNIREDNLQHLALFSEYGRNAVVKSSNGDRKPFQKMEFLVRDWQNFDDEEDIEGCETEMKKYLADVIANPTDANDLSDTRDQINICFEDVSCFLMPHPGKAVTKKSYSGDISVVDPSFKRFIDHYCGRVFGNVIAKSGIHGRELTAFELGDLIEAYAKLFEAGADSFPKATTWLESVVSANNTSASRLSIRKYKELMDKHVGSTYLSPEVLMKHNDDVRSECFDLFDEIACFGNGSLSRAIEKARSEVKNRLSEEYNRYVKFNDDRKPNGFWKGVGAAAAGVVGVAGASYLLIHGAAVTGVVGVAGASHLLIHGVIGAVAGIAVAVASFFSSPWFLLGCLGIISSIGLIYIGTVAAGATVVGASSVGTVATGAAVFWSGHYLSIGCLLIFSSILLFRSGSFAAGAAVVVTGVIAEIILQH